VENFVPAFSADCCSSENITVKELLQELCHQKDDRAMRLMGTLKIIGTRLFDYTHGYGT